MPGPQNTPPPLAGKVILVVGASVGIGIETARTLAADGAALMLVARTEGPLVELVEELEKAGYDAAYSTGDVSQAGDVSRFVDQTLERFGRATEL